MQNFVQVYMPSFIFVVASWISFVVKPEVVPGRMALLVTILLVQLNLFNNAKDKAPVSTNDINATNRRNQTALFYAVTAKMVL